MNSALERFASRGNYLFRISSFTAEILSAGGKTGCEPRVNFQLTIAPGIGSWPQRFWPDECQIACFERREFDKTTNDEVVLGAFICRNYSEKNRTLALLLLGDWRLIPSFHAALQQDMRSATLQVETETKVEEWDGNGLVPILSFSLVTSGGKEGESD